MDGNELRLLQAPLKKRYREQPETERTPARAEAVLKASSLLPGTEGSNPVPSRRESRANLKTTLLGRGIAGLESPAPAGITEILRILSPHHGSGGRHADCGGQRNAVCRRDRRPQLVLSVNT
jgi:hypothetical protein